MNIERSNNRGAGIADGLFYSQVMLAKEFPRDMKRVVEDCISTVSINKDLAEDMQFALRRGTKVIKGPSVYLARLLIQKMGNFISNTKILGYDNKHVTAEAIAVDLETNTASRVEVKRPIVDRNGAVYSADMQAVTGMAASSIALRNAVFNVIGKEIVDEVYTASVLSITGDLSDEQKLIAKRTAVVNGLKKNYHIYKLTDEEIAKSVGKSSVSNISIEDIAVLIGYEKSISSGEISVESVFRPGNDVTVKPVVNKEEKESERLHILIEAAATIQALESLKQHLRTEEDKTKYKTKFKSLQDGLQ